MVTYCSISLTESLTAAIWFFCLVKYGDIAAKGIKCIFLPVQHWIEVYKTHPITENYILVMSYAQILNTFILVCHVSDSSCWWTSNVILYMSADDTDLYILLCPTCIAVSSPVMVFYCNIMILHCNVMVLYCNVMVCYGLILQCHGLLWSYIAMSWSVVVLYCKVMVYCCLILQGHGLLWSYIAKVMVCYGLFTLSIVVCYGLIILQCHIL